MKQHIRTKWHKLKQIIETKGLYLTAPADTMIAPAFSDYVTDHQHASEVLSEYIDEVSKLPHFVIDEELVGLAAKEDYQQSLYDMKRAGVLRLPYPAMLIEFIDPRCDKSKRIVRNCVLVRDCHCRELQPWEHSELLQEADKLKADFYGLRIGIEEDAGGEYAVLSPSVVYISVMKKIDPNWRSDFPTPSKYNVDQIKEDAVWMQMAARANGILEWTKAYDELVGKTFPRDANYVFLAASAAYLIMGTGGVKQEIINTERINKKRDGVSKPFVPTHTYIRIGHVYVSGTSDKSEAYIPHKSPRPHWRRGHRRLQPFGPGRTSVREVYIRPRLVAYKGDFKDGPPKPPQYIVTE